MTLTVKKVHIAEVSAPKPGNPGPPTSPFGMPACFPR
jgi:hypothetical protein